MPCLWADIHAIWRRSSAPKANGFCYQINLLDFHLVLLKLLLCLPQSSGESHPGCAWNYKVTFQSPIPWSQSWFKKSWLPSIHWRSCPSGEQMASTQCNNHQSSSWLSYHVDGWDLWKNKQIIWSRRKVVCLSYFINMLKVGMIYPVACMKSNCCIFVEANNEIAIDCGMFCSLFLFPGPAGHVLISICFPSNISRWEWWDISAQTSIHYGIYSELLHKCRYLCKNSKVEA